MLSQSINRLLYIFDRFVTTFRSNLGSILTADFSTHLCLFATTVLITAFHLAQISMIVHILIPDHLFIFEYTDLTYLTILFYLHILVQRTKWPIISISFFLPTLNQIPTQFLSILTYEIVILQTLTYFMTFSIAFLIYHNRVSFVS